MILHWTGTKRFCGNNFIKLKGKVIFTLHNPITEWKEVKEYDNLITTAGMTMVARRLGDIGLLANEGIASYGATGTDATPPVAGNTQLGAELARKVFADTSYSANEITFNTFFNTGESNGVLKEWGVFGEAATGTANSGTLLEHAAIDITKTGAVTLTVETVITVSTV